MGEKGQFTSIPSVRLTRDTSLLNFSIIGDINIKTTKKPQDGRSANIKKSQILNVRQAGLER